MQNQIELFPSPFRVIIAGSRELPASPNLMLRDLTPRFDKLLSEKAKHHQITVLSGTARGSDRIGEAYAKHRDFKIEQFPANWDLYGKSAGYRRNVQMADNADALIAIWDGKSKGTKHMIEIAEKKGLFIRVLMVQNPKLRQEVA
tara:strand:+ start:848 stop:1282 length:435 start_codon:yes stop_codon:yes gene_type:complete